MEFIWKIIIVMTKIVIFICSVFLLILKCIKNAQTYKELKKKEQKWFLATQTREECYLD